MSRPVGPILDLDPYSGLFGLFVQQKALMQYPGADTGSSGPHWGEKEHTTFVHAH